MGKEDIGVVILDNEGKDGHVICPARWFQINFSDDLGCIINSALRYAIHRHTYMPGVVVAFIREYINILDRRTIEVVIRDIEEELKLYVQEHYQENFSIDTLAADAHISRSECFRCFKHYTGKTPVEYLNGYRLSAAANLLKSTEKTIAEICNICGFSSQSYFGKLFKQRYGISPLMFRNSAGN